ncbi:hypothetical protein [Arthrobacter globiformis]|uniref:Uncharacterized protein n=1 Tax=Arthrobacter globiformis TaxID=1665 RepID=A0A328HC76_ARTGO|nr:hypothetical protein [Arthrobacter globiformis]RAM36119.1 hypothetical protein DBZ45_18455 [Arthrobacter globiformis]
MEEIITYPEPPDLPAQKIRELIDYADRMATSMEAEMDMIRRLGKASPEHDLGEIIAGWKFTALAIRESYDGRF